VERLFLRRLKAKRRIKKNRLKNKIISFSDIHFLRNKFLELFEKRKIYIFVYTCINMENEIIKHAFRLGNSAGVLLPISWKDKKVKIQLINKSISQGILEIMEEKDLLKNVIGIFLAGSYAREEETESSDIDILIITDSINKQIKTRGYEIMMISKERFEKNLKKNLYLASMINESKTILNNDFIKNYKNKISNFPVKEYLEEIKSMMKINEKLIKIDEQMKTKTLDGTMYSIILRLRELYLIECLKINKKPSNKEFIALIRKISGSTEAYDSYLRIKNDKPSKKIETAIAKKLVFYIKDNIKLLEKGKKRKKE
jgi:predicted nucleotidyltransferase